MGPLWYIQWGVGQSGGVVNLIEEEGMVQLVVEEGRWIWVQRLLPIGRGERSKPRRVLWRFRVDKSAGAGRYTGPYLPVCSCGSGELAYQFLHLPLAEQGRIGKNHLSSKYKFGKILDKAPLMLKMVEKKFIWTNNKGFGEICVIRDRPLISVVKLIWCLCYEWTNSWKCYPVSFWNLVEVRSKMVAAAPI